MLKLEVGKYYRRRDGVKVGPMVRRAKENTIYPFICEANGMFYMASGAWLFDDEPSHLDLVAEWVDEPPVDTPAESHLDLARAIVDRATTAEARAIGMEARATAAEQEVARLRGLLVEAREALAPFAGEAIVWHSKIPDCRPVDVVDAERSGVPSFTVGDLRAARTVATKIKEAIGHE